uniref:Uncharacterized protein n=1 Tax=viral metagenome TaxID=1070528 RepID=A0A6C0BJY0_9ZZZZ
MQFASIVTHILEGLAITVAIYLVAHKSLQPKEFVIMVLIITATFMVLDQFAPVIAVGARQGSGFGLGFQQFAGDGNTMPLQYYQGQKVVEGMDDPDALEYYGHYNPQHANAPQVTMTAPDASAPNMVLAEKAQVPSVLLQEFARNPFDSRAENPADYPNSD